MKISSIARETTSRILRASRPCNRLTNALQEFTLTEIHYYGTAKRLCILQEEVYESKVVFARETEKKTAYIKINYLQQYLVIWTQSQSRY